MEKIYMEESKKQKKSVVDFSVVLSFVVAIFAVFSIATFGIVSNQGTGVSYAAPDADGNFTITEKTIIAYNTSDRQKKFVVHNYYNDATQSLVNQVFCIERRKDIDEGLVYSPVDTAREGTADLSEDAGLIYLLGLGQSGTAVTDYGSDIDGFVIQSAIWYYLADKYPDVDLYKLINNAEQDSDDKAVIETNGDIYIQVGGATATQSAYSGLSGSNGKIMELVNNAKAATVPKVTVTKSDDEVSKTEDGKFYQSALVSVVGTPSSNFSSYDVALSGIDGATIVDENGNDLALTNIAAGKKFYVRVPADKLSEEVKKIKIDVTGHFNGTKVKYYANANEAYQRLASLTPGDELGGIELEFVVTPDTGMNTAQTIYFIGLIVLLCGVGIVYANAKPIEAKQ